MASIGKFYEGEGDLTTPATTASQFYQGEGNLTTTPDTPDTVEELPRAYDPGAGFPLWFAPIYTPAKWLGTWTVPQQLELLKGMIIALGDIGGVPGEPGPQGDPGPVGSIRYWGDGPPPDLIPGYRVGIDEYVDRLTGFVYKQESGI